MSEHQARTARHQTDQQLRFINIVSIQHACKVLHHVCKMCVVSIPLV